MAQAQQMVTQSNIENGTQEDIPLNRLDESEDTLETRRLRNIFNAFDADGDGYLNVQEIKALIRSHQCDQMPKGVARKIFHLADENGDKKLDFNEFCKLSEEHDWIIRNYMVRYCQLIVPSPKRGPPRDEIDGQYERSMTFCPPPLTMVIFSIIEIIMFVVDIIHLKDFKNDVDKIGHSTKGPAATLFIYNPYRRYEAWRFATYMFVHIGVMHLIMNLLVQIFLGIALELVHCWWRVSLVYVAGVVAGSMGVSIASPNIYLAGASGGVYALITAHIATIIMNWSEMEYAIVQLLVFLVYILTDVGVVLYKHITAVQDQVSYISHLCGAIAGLLVGIGVLRNLKVHPWERKLWWCAVTLYIALMIFGIFIHIFLPNHFPQTVRSQLF